MRRLAGILIMIFGTGIVLIGTVVMNRAVSEPEVEEKRGVVSFSVPTPPPKKEQRERPPQRREITKSEQPALAPLPNLGSNLSGIAVDMPDYQPQVINEVAESVLGEIDENVVMSEDLVDTKPVVRAGSLNYPERAKQREIEGKVVVSILIGVDGRVKNMKILEAAPPGVFEESVRTALPNWTFEPAKYEGRSVQVWATIPLEFSLN